MPPDHRGVRHRIRPVFKENGGQNSAANAGFVAATGDVVMFLDADDVIADPAAGERIAERLRDGVAKFQWPMIHVGEALERLGTVWPRYDARHTPEWMVTSVRTTGFYPTPPTSGNAWTRRFLEAVFPLPVRAAGERRRWGLFFDDYLHMIAPWLGDVVSLAEPLSMYRLHGKMLSHFGGERPIGYIAEVCEEETDRMRAVNDFLAQRGIPFRYDFERYDDHLRGRLIYSRVLPERYPYADGKLALFVKYARAILRTERRPAKKLARIGWAAVTAFAPAPLGVKVGLLAA